MCWLVLSRGPEPSCEIQGSPARFWAVLSGHERSWSIRFGPKQSWANLSLFWVVLHGSELPWAVLQSRVFFYDNINFNSFYDNFILAEVRRKKARRPELVKSVLVKKVEFANSERRKRDKEKRERAVDGPNGGGWTDYWTLNIGAIGHFGTAQSDIRDRLNSTVNDGIIGHFGTARSDIKVRLNSTLEGCTMGHFGTALSDIRGEWNQTFEDGAIDSRFKSRVKGRCGGD